MKINSAFSLLLLAGFGAPDVSAQNYALRLGPSTRIEFPHHPVMNTTTAATMEFWFRADGPRGSTGWYRYSGSQEHKSFYVLANGGIDYLYAGSPWHQPSSGLGGMTILGAGTAPVDGGWHHMAFVRRANGTWAIFVDGVRILNEGPGTGLGGGCWLTCNIINAVTSTKVQNESSSLPSYDIDDLRISSTERYDTNFTPARGWLPDAATAMYLDFNEGSGAVVHDKGTAQQVGSFVGYQTTPTWEWLLVESSCGSDTLCYCTGKLNSLGCTPSITAVGDTSLGGADDLHILGSGFLPDTAGVLMWSRGPAALPFAGGTMCVANPTTRTAIQYSGNNGAGCTGRYDFHMTHAYMGSRLLQPGDIVHCQYISRDPASAPDRIALSGALRFIVKP
jgi:hypothetical protein